MPTRPKPGAGELDSDNLNRQGQLRQRSLSADEYQQKMDKVNRMRQQQGQAPLSVTPKDQIATPKSTATTVIPRTNNTASPNTTSASQIRTAPKMANDPKRPGLRAGGNSKVYDVQKELIRKGARIQADGVMGPNTQRAITQFFKPDKSNR